MGFRFLKNLQMQDSILLEEGGGEEAGGMLWSRRNGNESGAGEDLIEGISVWVHQDSGVVRHKRVSEGVILLMISVVLPV